MVALVTLTTAKKMTVEEKLRDDPDLSQFYAILERSQSVNSTLQYRHLTVFAPTNEAFQRYSGIVDEALMLYHIANFAVTLDQLGNSVNSELDGNPPLWISRRKNNDHEDIFINTAKIITHRSNYMAPNQNNKRQVLHIIDDVLVPVIPASSSSGLIYNPDAKYFLLNSENFDTQQHRVRSFRQKVTQLKKQDIFSNEGRHTFFIPIDEGFKPHPRPELIDVRVVDGHVIPDKVLFTKATQDDIPHETLAFGDNFQVIISFAKTEDGKQYIKSDTLVGDSKHATGVVIANIVIGNIPLRNGVVHLIDRPLMVVDTSVTQFLQDREDGPLFKLYEVIMDLGGDFMQTMTRMRDLTLFAPSNEAWKDPTLNNIIRNKEKLQEILNLHVVRERLPLNKIIENNVHELFQVQTAVDRKNLYFNVINHGNNQTLTVEGGGVNATVIQPNIAATNGIVHIINRVLGVPYSNILEKLQTDPMLNDTYVLGKKGLFNTQLNNTNHRFTYFVPRNKAWQKFQIEYPSAHKKMFMDDFSYHTRQILERHLVISDRAYTMADIKHLTNDTLGVLLPTMRDSLRLRIRESDNSYYVEWQNEWIHVFRPDVECTNGIIHVIDYPFLKESDIQVTGSGTSIAVTLAALITTNLIMLLIR
ncbi:fasciclin 1 Fas1 domain-containing isoform X2 [Arctopsyche grandis]|uniref:fasciclin 1 Fas1 domain-containing isoform X2 n=1 Tax=Arctopsyche grandis TaxID=121162 RepID=UPI00406D881A